MRPIMVASIKLDIEDHPCLHGVWAIKRDPCLFSLQANTMPDINEIRRQVMGCIDLDCQIIQVCEGHPWTKRLTNLINNLTHGLMELLQIRGKWTGVE